MDPIEISEVTRRAIVDFITISGIAWAGRLAEHEFLSRLYDLSTMRSTDSRMRNAAGDIIQHRISWNDWEDDWVFYDDRFNLLHAPDAEFLKFLCETIHPLVRSDSEQILELLGQYNHYLSNDGWSLIEVQQISGRPVFGPAKVEQRLQAFDDPTGWTKVERQIQAARDTLRTAETEENIQTVGLLCREAIISVAQEVYSPRTHALGGTVPSNTDANRMLEGFFNAELPGSTNEETRAYAKSALRTPNKMVC